MSVRVGERVKLLTAYKDDPDELKTHLGRTGIVVAVGMGWVYVHVAYLDELSGEGKEILLVVKEDQVKDVNPSLDRRAIEAAKRFMLDHSSCPIRASVILLP